MTTITTHVVTITTAITTINDHLTTALIALIATKINAFTTISSTHTLDYLIDAFSISRAEARRRIELAHALPPNQTTRTTTRTKRGTSLILLEIPGRETIPVMVGRTTSLTTHNPNPPTATPVSARKNTLSSPKNSHTWNPNTTPTAEQLRTNALKQAQWRTPEDLQLWLRADVTHANTKAPSLHRILAHLIARPANHLVLEVVRGLMMVGCSNTHTPNPRKLPACTAVNSTCVREFWQVQVQLHAPCDSMH